MNIEHNTPSLEDRISKQTEINDKILNLIMSLDNQVKELRKEYTSGRLALNELNILKKLKEKKLILLDLESMQFIEPKFV